VLCISQLTRIFSGRYGARTLSATLDPCRQRCCMLTGVPPSMSIPIQRYYIVLVLAADICFVVLIKCTAVGILQSKGQELSFRLTESVFPPVSPLTGYLCCIFSGIDIAVPEQEGGRAGRDQLPLLWDHSGNLQHAVDGARYGPGAIRSGKARFRITASHGCIQCRNLKMPSFRPRSDHRSILPQGII
jgi:hypothetical protein